MKQLCRWIFVCIFLTCFNSPGAPQLESLYPSLSLEHITLIFSEQVDGSAEEVSNYSLNGGVKVLGVERVREQTVRLKTSPQNPHTPYSVNIQNVRNIFGEPIVVTDRSFKSLYPAQYYESFESNLGNGVLSTAMGTTGAAFIEDGVLKLTKLTDAGTPVTYYILNNLNPGAKVLEFTAQFKARVALTGVTAADGFSFNFGPHQTITLWGEEGAGTGVTTSFDLYDNGFGEAPSVTVKFSALSPLLLDSTAEFTAGYGRKFATLLTGDRWADVMIHLRQDGGMSVFYDGQTVVTNALVPPAFFTNLANATFGFASRCGSPSVDHWIDDLTISTILDVPDRVQPKLVSSSATVGKIFLTFDKKMATHPAQNINNYKLTPNVPIAAAYLQSDWKTVVVVPAVPLCDDTNYSLDVSNLTDRASTPNVMTPNKTTVVVRPVAHWPVDLNQQVSGYQDNFTTPERDRAWVPSDAVENSFAQDEPAGILKVGSSSQGNQYLNFNKNYDPTQYEVLSRVRVTEFNGSGPGPGFSVGYTVPADGGVAQATSLLFGRDSNSSVLYLRNEGNAEFYSIPFAWELGSYYWVRLKLEQNTFYARVWAADGDADEPPDWTLSATTLLSGLAGIAAALSETDSSMDVDYYLLKSIFAPVITVDPDLCRRKPAPPPVDICKTISIQRIGAQVMVQWEGTCILQSAASVKGPFLDLPGDPPSPLTITPGSVATQSFFRLRAR